VPYNLFKLFLGHKISAYNYICENGKRKWEKKKRKGFSASWAGGGVFLAQPSARAAALASSPLGPPAGETVWGRRRGAGPHAKERGKADGVKR
jgi:hypothetical protein